MCASIQGANEGINPETAATLLGSGKPYELSGCGDVPLTYLFDNDPGWGLDGQLCCWKGWVLGVWKPQW